MVSTKPLDGRDALCIGDDPVGQVASFFTEVIFDSNEDTLVFVRRVLDGEQASACHGNDTDGAAASIYKDTTRVQMFNAKLYWLGVMYREKRQT